MGSTTSTQTCKVVPPGRFVSSSGVSSSGVSFSGVSFSSIAASRFSRVAFAFALVALLLSPLALPSIASAQEAEDQTEEANPPKLVYDEDAILSQFSASHGEVSKDGRVTLTYLFSSKDSNLLADWSPDISKTKRRIRWSQGYEGTWTTVEDGLIIADHGTFIHKATWDGDVEMNVDYLSMSASGKKDLFAAIYLWNKSEKSKVKKIVGSQYGEQCIQVTRNLTVSGRPIPLAALSRTSAEDRRTFGVRMRDGIVSSLRNGNVTSSSQGNEKFTKGVRPGQVGLAWKGLINGFIFKIEVEGKLAPEFLAEIPGAVRTVGAETAQSD